MPMDRSRYPANWEAIALEIKTSANWHCDHCRIVYAPWQWSRLGQTFVFCDDCMPLAREQASLSRTGDDFIKWVYCLPDDYEF